MYDQATDSRHDYYAHRLVERLAGFPLALATAGTFLHTSACSFERYLQEYEAKWAVNSKLPEYGNRTLYTTWDLSYKKLCTEAPVAARLLKLLAYFDNQNIRLGLFRHVRPVKQRRSAVDRVKRLLHGQEKIAGEVMWLQEADLENAMDVLVQHHFLEAQADAGSYSMHNIVHDWTLFSLNVTIDIPSYTYAFDYVNAMIDRNDFDFLGHLTYAGLAPFAARLTHPHFMNSTAVEANVISDRYVDTTWVAELLHGQLLFPAAEQMYRRALAGYEKVPGLNHTSTLGAVYNLGILYRGQGKLELAEQMNRRALAGYEKALGPDHTSTLDTVINLGILYRDQGKLELAEQMYRRALAGYEKALGPSHTRSLLAVSALAILYCAQSKLQGARSLFERALTAYQNIMRTTVSSTDVIAGYAAALSMSIITVHKDPSVTYVRITCLIQLVQERRKAAPEIMLWLGKAMVLVQDDEAAQSGFRFAVRRIYGEHADFHVARCHGCACRITINTGWYICRQCANIDLCHQCMMKYPEHGLRMCIKHEFFMVDAASVEGTASTAPRNNEEIDVWLADLSRKYEMLSGELLTPV